MFYSLRDETSGGRGNARNSRQAEDKPEGNRIVAELAPGPRDILIAKRKPSAFFGTPLLETLTGLRCDTLVIAGCTTSGCVRATAVDGFSHDLRVAVPADAVFDRSQASHAIGLFDLNAKYADVMDSVALAAYFSALPQGLFDWSD